MQVTKTMVIKRIYFNRLSHIQQIKNGKKTEASKESNTKITSNVKKIEKN